MVSSTFLSQIEPVGFEPTVFTAWVSDFKSDAFRQFRHDSESPLPLLHPQKSTSSWFSSAWLSSENQLLSQLSRSDFHRQQ